MQTSELYRRGIVLPLDDQAERSLRANDIDLSTKVHFLEIPDGFFDSLRRHGLFDEINLRCGALLDDYEEEIIEASSLDGVLAAVDEMVGKTEEREPELEFLTQFHALIRKAISTSRPLLFEF